MISYGSCKKLKTKILDKYGVEFVDSNQIYDDTDSELTQDLPEPTEPSVEQYF